MLNYSKVLIAGSQSTFLELHFEIGHEPWKI